MVSDPTKAEITPEHQAIIHGALKLAASLLAPFIFKKFPKKMAFVIFGAIASFSMATGKKVNEDFFACY